MITTKNLILTIEDLKNKIPATHLYLKYVSANIKFNQIMSSPLRVDKHPSFIIFNNGNFYDHANHDQGDVIDFFTRYWNMSFNEVINKIISDYYNEEELKTIDLPVINSKSSILPYYRKWHNHDKEFWTAFSISKSTLSKLNVHPVAFYKINNYFFTADKHAYCYNTGSRFKIYQPFSLKYKFIGNTNENSIFGYHLLSWTNDILFIVSSLKEVAIMLELGYEAIAPNSESSWFKKEIMDKLKTCYKTIIVLFDSDEEGFKLAQLFCDYYQDLFKLELKLPAKDLSDFVKDFSLNELKQIIINETNKMGIK